MLWWGGQTRGLTPAHADETCFFFQGKKRAHVWGRGASKVVDHDIRRRIDGVAIDRVRTHRALTHRHAVASVGNVV